LQPSFTLIVYARFPDRQHQDCNLARGRDRGLSESASFGSHTAQLFSGEKRFTWRIKQDAASNSGPRIVPSPHFDTRPDQSISPD